MLKYIARRLLASDPGPVRAVDHPVRVRPPAPGRPRDVAPRPARDARAAPGDPAPSSGSTSRSTSSTSCTSASCAQGDLGKSIINNRTVAQELALRFPATVELTLGALLFAVGLGIPLGRLAARHAQGWTDGAVTIISLLGISIPIFVLGLTMQYIFAVQLEILPASGRIDPRLHLEVATNFVLIDSLLTGNWEAFVDALKHLILPAIALGSIPLAIICRITRASVLDVNNEDYVRTARAKGLSEKRVDYAPHHAQRLAAGRDRHRAPGRRAPGRCRHHRDRVRLARASEATSWRRSRTMTTSSSSR